MTEDFMTWMWMHVLSEVSGLSTQCGAAIEVFSPGIINRDSGPDIFNARIRVGDILWVGNVEMHVRSSNWEIHGHQNDPAYDNVILHVVLDHDQEVYDSKLRKIPVLIMPPGLNEEYWSKYQKLTSSLELVACDQELSALSPADIGEWTDRMLAERMERMLSGANDLVSKGITIPSEIFFHLLAKNMGFRVNSIPFSMLAQKIPGQVLRRIAGNRLQTEALLFGLSGLLPEHHDDPYVTALHKEYSHLRSKFGFKEMDPRVWKFMRMRPNNFPVIRISQLADLAGRIERVVEYVIQKKELSMLYEMLEAKASPFWNNHYTFSETTGVSPKVLGRDSVENILINSVAVFSHWYGRCVGDPAGTDYAMRILKSCRPEDNKFMRQWKRAGVKGSDASETQALYHLITQYCSQKKCLNCAWGSKLIRKTH